MREPAIAVALCIENIHKAFAATDIEAVSLWVEEQIVGITAGFDARDAAAVRLREHAKHPWIAKDDEDPLGLLVEDHREVAFIACRPRRDLLAGDPIHDG